MQRTANHATQNQHRCEPTQSKSRPTGARWDYDLSVPLAQGPRCLPPAQRRSIAQSFSLRPRVTDGDFLMLTLLAGILRFYPRSSAVAKHPPNLFAVQS